MLSNKDVEAKGSFYSLDSEGVTLLLGSRLGGCPPLGISLCY